MRTDNQKVLHNHLKNHQTRGNAMFSAEPAFFVPKYFFRDFANLLVKRTDICWWQTQKRKRSQAVHRTWTGPITNGSCWSCKNSRWMSAHCLAKSSMEACCSWEPDADAWDLCRTAAWRWIKFYLTTATATATSTTTATATATTTTAATTTTTNYYY